MSNNDVVFSLTVVSAAVFILSSLSTLVVIESDSDVVAPISDVGATTVVILFELVVVDFKLLEFDVLLSSLEIVVVFFEVSVTANGVVAASEASAVASLDVV